MNSSASSASKEEPASRAQLHSVLSEKRQSPLLLPKRINLNLYFDHLALGLSQNLWLHEPFTIVADVPHPLLAPIAP